MFARFDASVIVAVNGIQALAGVIVKSGMGGFSIHTVLVITFVQQLLVVVNVTV